MKRDASTGSRQFLIEFRFMFHAPINTLQHILAGAARLARVPKRRRTPRSGRTGGLGDYYSVVRTKFPIVQRSNLARLVWALRKRW